MCNNLSRNKRTENTYVYAKELRSLIVFRNTRLLQKQKKKKNVIAVIGRNNEHFLSENDEAYR